jgi:LuxR family transcriptional regulator, maltose regulon positive regulatory protein
MTRNVSLGPRSSDWRAELADAIVAAAEGRLAHAQRAAERAARGTVEGGLWRAWISLELAAIQLRRGLTDAARRSLDLAGELVEVARDAGRLPAQADALRRALDSAHAQVTAPPTELPSPAEHAVLRLLPDLTVREIGEALYLSPNTVKSHVRSLYRKLGVGSRQDAVARAVALGLIDEPSS